MSDKIINIFNKQPVNNVEELSEVNEIIDDLNEMKDNISELLLIVLTKDDEMLVKSGNMTRESAYFVLGLAQLNALTQ